MRYQIPTLPIYRCLNLGGIKGQADESLLPPEKEIFFLWRGEGLAVTSGSRDQILSLIFHPLGPFVACATGPYRERKIFAGLLTTKCGEPRMRRKWPENDRYSLVKKDVNAYLKKIVFLS